MLHDLANPIHITAHDRANVPVGDARYAKLKHRRIGHLISFLVLRFLLEIIAGIDRKRQERTPEATLRRPQEVRGRHAGLTVYFTEP
jgi:hypothetical protein